MAASLINRLPFDKRQTALRRLSRNANAPGASLRQTNGRAQARLSKRAGELGILLIESNVTGSLAASVGGVNPPGVALFTVDSSGAMTPTTTDITASELDPVTYAASGTKVLSIIAPAGLSGEAYLVL